MISNPLYKLKKLAGIPYLLPIGQKLADRKKSWKLNDTGAFIFSQLKQEKNIDKLIGDCAVFFEENPDDEEFRQDITAFADNLAECGVILRDIPEQPASESGTEKKSGISDLYPSVLEKQAETEHSDFSSENITQLKIADIHISIEGDKAQIPPFFEMFRESSPENTVSQTSEADNISNRMYIQIINRNPGIQHIIPSLDSSVYGVCTCARCSDVQKIKFSNIPSAKSVKIRSGAGLSPMGMSYSPAPAKVLINHPELTVFEEDETYAIYFHDTPSIYLMRCSKDGAMVQVYCDEKKDEEALLHLFHAIRMPFLLYAAKKGYIMLHSASILYNGKAWLFSGQSGTGKSTHTNLWNKLWDTPLINGDLNLIRATADNGQFFIYGTPWCGTSEICDNEVHELGGIVFLKQAPSNYCKELSPDERRLNIFQRLITPMWTEEMLDNVLAMIDNIADVIFIRRLFCTPEDEAAQVMRDEIRSL